MVPLAAKSDSRRTMQTVEKAIRDQSPFMVPSALSRLCHPERSEAKPRDLTGSTTSLDGDRFLHAIRDLRSQIFVVHLLAKRDRSLRRNQANRRSAILCTALSLNSSLSPQRSAISPESYSRFPLPAFHYRRFPLLACEGCSKLFASNEVSLNVSSNTGYDLILSGCYNATRKGFRDTSLRKRETCA